MSAATAAMFICLEEDRRRRDPDYEPLCSLYDLIMMPWAGALILLIEIAFCVAMIYISLK